MRRNALAVGLVAVLLIAAAALVVAQAPSGPQGRGPGRGMMAAFMYLERSWTAVSFQLNCTSEQLAALKPTYANTLAAREAAVKKALVARDWDAAGKAMQDSKTRLETKLKQVLTSQQWTKLQQLLQPPTGMMHPTSTGAAAPGQ
jgi:hypothetical protein